MQNIIEVQDTTIDYLIALLTVARENEQTVKVCVDGGLKVKRGESMWTPPLGYPVDGNGQRIG